MHRNLHGERNDHALLECTWRWRIRQIARTPCKDYDCLYIESKDEQGRPIPNEKLQQFEYAIETKLEELDFDADADDSTTIYEKMCAAIQHAVDTTLPDQKKSRGIKSKISEHTQSFYETRRQLRGKGTNEQFEALQGQIVTVTLPTFNAG